MSFPVLKVLDALHLAILFSLKSLFIHWVVRTDPGEGVRGLLNNNVQSGLQLLQFPMQNCIRGTVNISLLRAAIFGHRWKSILLHEG